MSDEPIPSTDFVIADRRGRTAEAVPTAANAKSPWPSSAARAALIGARERRRQVDPTTCEKEYSDDEIIFMKSMDQYKRANRRPFPTWSEVLEVLHALGYRKTEAATEMPGLQPKPAGGSPK